METKNEWLTDIKGCLCQRCEHTWKPKIEEDKPIVCPKCKSPYWNKPKIVSNQ